MQNSLKHRNERLDVSGRLVSWGAFHPPPIGSKTVYQLRKASRTPELQAPLPGHSFIWNPFIPLRTCKSIREREEDGVKHFVLALLRDPYLDPPS